MLKIGLLFSLTGTTSLTEVGQLHAAQYALEEQKQAEFAFIIRDIKSDPNEAYTQAKILAESGVRIFVGMYSSACRIAILPVLEEYNCLLVYPALYEGDEAHPNVIYTGEVPNQQIYIMLKYIERHYGSNIYLIGNDYIYPRKTHMDLKSYLKMVNGFVIGERTVPLGHVHYKEILEEISQKPVHAVISTLVGTSLVHFYQSFKEFGFDQKNLPIFSPITKETEIQAIGKEETVGHYSSGSYFQSLQTKENVRFVTGLRKKYGKDFVISSVMFNTYLGVSLLLNAMKSVNYDDPILILNHLKGLRLKTPCGEVEIDPNNHHINRPIRIGKVNTNGQFQIVWDSKEALPAKPFLKKKYNSIDSHSWQSILQQYHYKDRGILLLNTSNEVVFSNYASNEILPVFEGQKPMLSTITRLKKDYQINEKEIELHPHTYKLFTFDKKIQLKNDEEIYQFAQIKTKTPSYKDELKIAEVAAQSSANVLLTGETGAGKEVLANAIHLQSERRNGPFIAINTGAIPRELIASELFGFVGGAFTGAKKGGQIGKFEMAHNGTLFLDEIGEMPLDLQVSLLRVLETRRITRLGDRQERMVDVRIIAATHKNLKEEIAFQGNFRSDLFYRLNVINIHIPPLRQCHLDIPILIKEFLKQLNKQYTNGPTDLTKEVLQSLMMYTWPGNIRELKNVIERAFLLAKNNHDLKLQSHHLPKEVVVKQTNTHESLDYSLSEAERKAILKVLKISTNISHASQLLGISRSTLYRKIKEHHIDIPS